MVHLHESGKGLHVEDARSPLVSMLVDSRLAIDESHRSDLVDRVYAYHPLSLSDGERLILQWKYC